MSKEVVVLGAGMVGTGTALALQAKGYNVLLVDRAEAGSETSYGNAGFIQGEACEPYALPRDAASLWRIARKRDNAVEWDLAGLWRLAPSLLSYWRNSSTARHRSISRDYAELIRRATRDHARWIAASASEGLVRRDGYRTLFREPGAFDRQLRTAEQWRSLYGVGFDCEDGAALAAAESALRHPMAGAIRWHDAWTCSDPGALVRAYAGLFVRQGGELRTAECRGLDPTRQGWKILTREGQAIETAQVVVALGPWSPQLLAPLGYRIPMIPKRGYHMHFRYPDGNDASAPRLDLPLLDPAMGAVYAPMRAGLRIATGADISAGARVGMPRQLERACTAARELLDFGPQLEASAWVGTRPCMPDMMPMVGAAPRHAGLWFNFGHGHQGFTLGPTTGELLAGMMTGEPDAAADPLSPGRQPRP